MDDVLSRSPSLCPSRRLTLSELCPSSEPVLNMLCECGGSISQSSVADGARRTRFCSCVGGLAFLAREERFPADVPPAVMLS